MLRNRLTLRSSVNPSSEQGLMLGTTLQRLCYPTLPSRASSRRGTAISCHPPSLPWSSLTQCLYLQFMVCLSVSVCLSLFFIPLLSAQVTPMPYCQFKPSVTLLFQEKCWKHEMHLVSIGGEDTPFNLSLIKSIGNCWVCLLATQIECLPYLHLPGLQYSHSLMHVWDWESVWSACVHNLKRARVVLLIQWCPLYVFLQTYF